MNGSERAVLPVSRRVHERDPPDLVWMSSATVWALQPLSHSSVTEDRSL